MKFSFNYILAFKLIIVLTFLFSCRSDDDELQKVDQIFNLYMKDSAGQDLLNKNKEGSFFSYSVNDALGDTDVAAVSIPLKMTSDSLYYMEYIAGAKRKTIDSISPDDRTYHSVLELQLRRTVNNVTDTINDVMEIQYHWTPSVFEISKVYYNGELKFMKEPNAPNVVTIVK